MSNCFHHRFTTLLGGAAFGLAALLAAGAPGAHAQSTLNRPADPVVMTGADIPSLNGITPQSLLAFRYNNGWTQIPVQVDERAIIDLAVIHNNAPIGKTILTYTDASTWAGSDPDATIDGNDEIVFMARDAGGRPASFSEPAGVVAGTGVEVTVVDPLNSTQKGYVYVFRQSGSLDPGAGWQYGTYTFNLLSGNYKTTYRTTGSNPENSSINTAYYFHDYKDRWINEILKIKAGGSTQADILDRHKGLYALGVCTRSEETFSRGGGAFIINKNGPVRGIRSFMGANSGPYTQREHLFYEQRQDVITYLRVHDIAAFVDFFDYSPAAIGMRYRNELNPAGAIIDGVADQMALGLTEWEMVNGAPGSLLLSHQVFTNIPGFNLTSVYLDDSKPRDRQCTGDAFAYAQSGPWMQGLPCTDPSRCADPYNVTSIRSMYYGAPELTVSDAETFNDRARNPLIYSSLVWRP